MRPPAVLTGRVTRIAYTGGNNAATVQTGIASASSTADGSAPVTVATNPTAVAAVNRSAAPTSSAGQPTGQASTGEVRHDHAVSATSRPGVAVGGGRIRQHACCGRSSTLTADRMELRTGVLSPATPDHRDGGTDFQTRRPVTSGLWVMESDGTNMTLHLQRAPTARGDVPRRLLRLVTPTAARWCSWNSAIEHRPPRTPVHPACDPDGTQP